MRSLFIPPIVVLALALSAPALAADDATTSAAPQAPRGASGIVMLDYQAIKINGYPSIDLFGFHVLNRFNDWLYFGVGGHAPLFKGEYGGFMAFDATLHAERRLFGNWSASAGASLGGGGGGRSVEQSKIISGSGGFIKRYVGIGYRLNDLSVGLNYSNIRFTNSVIHGSQFGLYVQAPFSYSVAPYAQAGRSSAGDPEKKADSNRADRDVVTVGVDNIIQIDPKGSFRKTINLVDAQYNHFLNDNYYVLFGGSVGYHGLPAYNQAYGGIGYRYAYNERLSVSAQLGVGSGGYAPEKFDTGPGLLVYPKLSAEYRFSDHWGVSLTGGYLYAPRGSSRNATLGATLNYHVTPSRNIDAAADASTYSGHRLHLFLQTEYDTQVGTRDQGQLKLLTMQIDTVVNDNVYVPIQGSVAYNAYLGYPGYGEVLAGLGVQSKYSAGDSFQTFAQLLVGTNVHGIIAKPAVGVNFALSDRLALYGQVGSTASIEALGYPKQYRFRSTTLGLGLTYRFSRL